MCVRPRSDLRDVVLYLLRQHDPVGRVPAVLQYLERRPHLRRHVRVVVVRQGLARVLKVVERPRLDRLLYPPLRDPLQLYDRLVRCILVHDMPAFPQALSVM